MSPSSGSFSVAGLVLRILARCLALLFILILLAFMMPEPGESLFAAERWSDLDPWMFVYPLGFLFGLILILWKDVYGGIISVGCVVAMYIKYSLTGEWLGPILAFGAIPGALGIIAWILTRRYASALPANRGGV